MLDRQKAPEINAMYDMSVKKPERRRMKNGMALNIIEAGTQEVVRLDVLIGAGQWHQTQSLQALFANRMLREGTISMTSAQIAEKLDYYGAWLELSSSPNCGFITLYCLQVLYPLRLHFDHLYIVWRFCCRSVKEYSNQSDHRNHRKA